jgi:hypothetical protein
MSILRIIATIIFAPFYIIPTLLGYIIFGLIQTCKWTIVPILWALYYVIVGPFLLIYTGYLKLTKKS